MKWISDLYHLINEKKYSTLSGSMAFFIIVNGSATLFIAFVIANSLEIDLNLLFIKGENLPEDVQNILTYIVSTSSSFSNGYSIIFLFTSLWGASNLFYQFLQTGELIFGKGLSGNGLFRRTLSLIILALFLVVLVICLLTLIVANYLVLFVNVKWLNVLWSYIAFLFVPFTLLTFINLYIPPVKIRIKGALLGALFTSLFWYIASSLFSFYLKYFSNFKIIYGALTFILVFMIWIYLLTNGLVIGFIINFNYQKLTGDKKNIKDTITNGVME